MKTKSMLTFILTLIFLFSPAYPAVQEKPEPPPTSDIVIGKTDVMYSDILNEWRTLEYYLPGGWEREEKKYPLLVVLDAGDLFVYMVSFIGMLSPHYFPKMVVIGVRNTDRGRDLNARDGLNDNVKRFHRFLEEELIPYVEKKYRTMPDFRILAGHSLAGAFTLHTLLNKPGLFNAYIATSPSIREDQSRGVLAKTVDSLKVGALKQKYLYVTAGGGEPEGLHQALRDLDKQFTDRRFPQFKWDYSIYEKEGHVPIKGFYQGLRNIFEGWMPPLKMFLNGSAEEIKSHYKKLSEKFGFEVIPPYAVIGSIGRQHLRGKRINEAVKIFEYYIKVYPEAVNGRLTLAQTYIDSGQKKKAKETLNKVLELDPKNKRAKELLQSL